MSANATRNSTVRRPGQNDGLSPQMALHAIRRWWKLAAPAAILLAAASSAIVLLTFEKQYQAEAILQISQRRPHLVFPDKEGSERFVETQIQLLRTPAVLLRVVGDSTIADPALKQDEDPVRYLQQNVQVSAMGRSELYRITYTASQPEHAKQVVKAVVEAYLSHVASNDASRSRSLMESLALEIDSKKKNAERLRSDLRAASLKPGVSTAQLPVRLGGLGITASPLSDLRSRAVQAEVEIILLGAEVEYERSVSQQEIEISDDDIERAIGPDLLARKQGIDARKKQFEELKERFTGGSSPLLQREMARMQADEAALADFEIRVRAYAREELTAQAKAQRDAKLGMLETKLATAQATFNTLKEKLAQEEAVSPNSLDGQLKIDFLSRELEQAESVCDMLVARHTQLSTEQFAPERVTPITAPDQDIVMAPYPVATFPYKQLALALMVSLCFPFGLAVVWEQLAKRISSVEEIEQQIGVEVLGEIVTLPKFGTSRRSIQRSAETRQLFEESVDGLRTTLVLSDSTRDMHVLAVASAVSSEGKTSVATELAISIARTTGKPTLLIDGDMRAPDIHRMFDVPVNPGLAEILSGEAAFDDSVVETDSPNLSVLTAGLLTSSPHRLLHNGEFAQMLTQARKQYDYIIIDTPPVLAASESLVMTKQADATLVCAMRDRTRLSHIRRAHSRLVGAGAQPIGVVMSGLPVRSYASRYGSYSYKQA